MITSMPPNETFCVTDYLNISKVDQICTYSSFDNSFVLIGLVNKQKNQIFVVRS